MIWKPWIFQVYLEFVCSNSLTQKRLTIPYIPRDPMITETENGSMEPNKKPMRFVKVIDWTPSSSENMTIDSYMETVGVQNCAAFPVLSLLIPRLFLVG